jgi:hypothetical protein
MQEPRLTALIRSGAARVHRDFSRYAPTLADHTRGWIESLLPGRPLHEYFSLESGYPTFALPWWLARLLSPRPDAAFDRDLVYSTINGYYYVRLIDNLMDADASTNLVLLPSTALFHSRFQGLYARHFPSEHPFWDCYERAWFTSHDATAEDHLLTSVDYAAFERICAAKTSGAKVPVFAVCHRYQRADLIAFWDRYCDRIGLYIQAVDDLQDWALDAEQPNRTTYFLSEADRRRRGDETRSHWILREGLDWATALCLGWLDELEAGAREIECDPLAELWVERRRRFLRDADQMRAMMGALTPLGRFFRGSGKRPHRSRKTTRSNANYE